jgi:U3 small nucleolar RNA-associated protein MPP10
MAATKAEQEMPVELGQLSQLIESAPETLATGSKDIQIAALNATKYIFDLGELFLLIKDIVMLRRCLAMKSEAASRKHIVELLSSLSPAEAPKTRSQTKAAANSAANGHEPARPVLMLEPTPLSSLFINGMDDEQIWAQLDLRARNVCDTLEHALEDTVEDYDDAGSGSGEEDEDEESADFEGLEDMEELGSEEDSGEYEDEQGTDDNTDEPLSDSVEAEEQIAELRDSDEDDEADADAMDLDRPSRKATLWDKIAPKLSVPKRKTGGHPELDDGFFSLADFNAETEEAEARKVTRGGLSKTGDEDESDSDADFDDNVDFFAPVDNMEDLDPEAEEDTSGRLYICNVRNMMLIRIPAEPHYKDFFEPPPRTSKRKDTRPKSGKVRFHDEVRVKSIKARGKGMPVSTMSLIGDAEDEDEECSDQENGLIGDDDMVVDDFDEEPDDLDDEDDEEVEADQSSDEDEDISGRNAIERLKDDLFAEDEDDDTRAFMRSRHLNLLIRSLCQTSARTRNGWKHSESRLHSWKRKMLARKTGCSWAKPPHGRALKTLCLRKTLNSNVLRRPFQLSQKTQFKPWRNASRHAFSITISTMSFVGGLSKKSHSCLRGSSSSKIRRANKV